MPVAVHHSMYLGPWHCFKNLGQPIEFTGTAKWQISPLWLCINLTARSAIGCIICLRWGNYGSEITLSPQESDLSFQLWNTWQIQQTTQKPLQMLHRLVRLQIFPPILRKTIPPKSWKSGNVNGISQSHHKSNVMCISRKRTKWCLLGHGFKYMCHMYSIAGKSFGKSICHMSRTEPKNHLPHIP